MTGIARSFGTLRTICPRTRGSLQGDAAGDPGAETFRWRHPARRTASSCHGACRRASSSPRALSSSASRAACDPALESDASHRTKSPPLARGQAMSIPVPSTRATRRRLQAGRCRSVMPFNLGARVAAVDVLPEGGAVIDRVIADPLRTTQRSDTQRHAATRAHAPNIAPSMASGEPSALSRSVRPPRVSALPRQPVGAFNPSERLARLSTTTTPSSREDDVHERVGGPVVSRRPVLARSVLTHGTPRIVDPPQLEFRSRRRIAGTHGWRPTRRLPPARLRLPLPYEQ